MPSTYDVQGGKEHARRLAELELSFDKVNEEFLNDDHYSQVESLAEKLQQFKAKFIECDRDLSGDLDMMDLKYMLEKLGQPKTHLELKKMIAQVDKRNAGSINYTDFVLMMLGKHSVLRMIFLFEQKGQQEEKPKGVAPKRDLASLP